MSSGVRGDVGYAFGQGEDEGGGGGQGGSTVLVDVDLFFLGFIRDSLMAKK